MEISTRINLLERDFQVLKSLSKTKMMTVNQIMRLYFNSKGYGYRRMKQLEKAGYVTSRPHVEIGTGRKKGTCYYLTRGGYKIIGLDHYNPTKLIEPRKHDYREKVSELYVQLTPVGWKFTGSSEVKAAYNLNRNTRLACMLTRENPFIKKGKDKFAVYLLGNNPLEDTILKTQAELTRNEKDINCAIVLHFGTENNIVYKTKNHKMVEWTEHLGMYRLHIMQYEKGLHMLKPMVSPNYILDPPFKAAIEEIGAKYIGHESGLFSDHLIEYGGRTCYLVELASNNLTDIYHLRHYSVEEAKIKDRLVVVLVPKGEITYWQEQFDKRVYPHFKFFPVDLNDTKMNTCSLHSAHSVPTLKALPIQCQNMTM